MGLSFPSPILSNECDPGCGRYGSFFAFFFNLFFKCVLKVVETELEERIRALEVGAKYDVTQEAIRQREMEFLATLQEIRAAMVQEENSGMNSAQVEDLKKENEKLKATIAKQEYRIRHLIHGMEAMMQKAK